MSHRAEIIRAAARAAYVQAWASYMDEQGERYYAPGQDLMDIAPKTPATATAWARKLIKTMEKFNGMSIDKMYAKAAAMPLEHSWEKEATPEDFGHYTAMQSLGHGVGWDDDHPKHGFRIPHSEFYCHSARGCDGYVSDRPGIGSTG